MVLEVSIARNENVASPDMLGVPPRTPAELRSRPVGTVPEVTENVTDPCEEVAVSVALYPTPTTKFNK